MKKNISSGEALKIIVEAAKNYDIKLNDKHFLIVYHYKVLLYQKIYQKLEIDVLNHVQV